MAAIIKYCAFFIVYNVTEKYIHINFGIESKLEIIECFVGWLDWSISLYTADTLLGLKNLLCKNLILLFILTVTGIGSLMFFIF